MKWQIYPHQQRHVVAKNGNFRFLLLKLIYRQISSQIYSPSPVETSSGQECQFQISIVKAHIGRSSGRYTPQQRHLVATNGNFQNIVVKNPYRQMKWQIYPPCKRNLVAKNGHFQISIVKAHIGRSAGRSTPRWRHLVAKNGNFQISIVKALIGRSAVRSIPP